MAVTTSTEHLAERGRRLIDEFRDEAEGLAKYTCADERRPGIAELATEARNLGWLFNRLGCDLADLAGGLPLPSMVHHEELLAELRAGEHQEEDE